jgi:uncharacterized HAD superfamily protein
MIIGIDIDDTISDTYACIFPYAQKYTIEDLGKKIGNGGKFSTNHMYVEGFHKWNEEEARNFFDKYYESILLNVRPKLFAVETIQKLKEEGHKIILITARFLSKKFDVKELTLKWLEDNKIYYDELIINAQNKVEVAQNKEIDLFVDDSIQNCEKMIKTQIRTYIMNTITNSNYENEEIKRIYSWPHLYQEINNYEGGK